MLRGMPLVIARHVRPKSVVLYTNGSRLLTWCKSTVRYAVPASYRAGSMLPTVPHGGRFGMFFVTLVHDVPLSRVTLTCPSLVPAQINPRSSRDSAMAITVNAYSTPMLSPVSPPENCWRVLSLVDRSGLITSQLWPRLLVRCTCWLPTYTVLRSCGDIASGIVQLKR